MGAHRLRILHVSDLHVVDPAKDRYRQRRGLVLGKAWDENLDEIARDGPIDLVCFTGDLAFSGSKAEYDRLTVFVDAMLARVGVPRSRFFVVPGNHDADRKIAPDAVMALRKLDDEEKLSAWMLGGPPPPGTDATHLDAVLKRQGAYRRWVRSKLNRPELLPGKRAAHPTLGYRQTIRVRDLPFDVHVIGLDSAWLAHDDNDSRKLRLTRDQVLRLSAGPDGELLGGFRLALIHHPLTDLADGESCRRLLAEQVDLLLRGHLHESELSFWSDADREMRELVAGSLYGGDMWPNGCQVVDISLDEEGRPSGYDLWFRGWSSRGRGFWINEDGLYKGTRNGRLSWPPRIRVRDPIRRPHDVFVGREKEMAALEAALLPASGTARPVAIGALQGMPGVGKSYLADHFALVHKDRFPGGYVKLVLNADESRSVGDLGSALAMQLDVPWEGESTWERMRAKLLGSRALLHIENADAETSAQATAALVAWLDGCAVIVSGRYQGLGAGVWSQITIDTLDEETAIELLQREAETEIAFEDKKKLARELGCLPLALHLAGGHLRAKVSVELFLRKLRDRKNLLGIGPRNLLLDKEDKRGILSSTFAISLDLLKTDCGENGEIWMQSFATLGHAPASGVGKSLGAAMAGLSEDDFEDLMARAVQLSLATRGTTARMAWSIHPLLAELLRARVSQDAQWMQRMTEWFLERLPEPEYARPERQQNRWKAIGLEREALVTWLASMPRSDAMLISRPSCVYAWINGPFSAWMVFFKRVLEETEDPEVQSDVLLALSGITKKLGLLDDALKAAQRKVQLDQCNGNELGVAKAQGAIADVLHARADFDEALRIRIEEQLPVYKRYNDLRSYAITQNKIADVLLIRRKFDEALRILNEQITVYEQLGDVRERAVTMGKIADIYRALGNVDEAIRIIRNEEIPVYKRLDEVRSLLISRTNLAQLLLSRKLPDERAEAARLLQLALHDAEVMGIPEAARIRTIQLDHNLT